MTPITSPNQTLTKRDFDKNQYYRTLKARLEKDEASLDYNNDRAHNAVVMKLMFDIASKKVCMYCGELSILRNGFRKHVIEAYGDDSGNEIMNDLYNSLDTFLNKEGTSFNIILEKKQDGLFDDLSRKDSFIKNRNKICLSYLGDDIAFKEDLSHFAFTDKITRIEQNKLIRNAICSFNSETSIKDLENRFEILSRFANPVYIPN